MKHLVVYAHPNPKSFNHAICERVVKTAKENGDEVVVRDLYALGYDPILKGSDFVSFKQGVTPEDIKVEQEHITWADIITFIHPVWWTSMPSVLQGYYDRVFSYGYAYVSTDQGVKGLLGGKKAFVFTTTGNSKEAYEVSGVTDGMKLVRQASFEFVGITDVTQTHFNAVPYVGDDVRHQYLDEVEKVLTK
ncbi:MAG TPA: NAD(P)H dehydrogenase [Firmicutes bacterium]|nr:NAD(P)H dehydrogenase [Bacillota bacterium]